MLRDYQQDAVTAIEQAAESGVRRHLLVLPTGCGKTIVFSEVVRRRGGRALVLVHRDELARQAVDKLSLVVPRSRLGIVKTERDEHGAQVVVGSVQTLARTSRLERMVPDFDEAHHVTATTYQRILTALGAGTPDGPLALGCTATPERGDGVPLEGWHIVYRRSPPEMIAAGYLSDLRALRVRLDTDFNRLHVRAGDYDREVEQALLDANAPEHAARAHLEHASGRRALVFTPTVAVAHAMADAMTRFGIVAEALDGETRIEVRRAMLRRFARGETLVIANCGVLTEGLDEPSVACIIVACPTRSKLLYVQMIGRGSRRHPCHGRHGPSWWRWEELNLRHGAYETPALPLSYTAEVGHRRVSGPSVPQEARQIHVDEKTFCYTPRRAFGLDDSAIQRSEYERRRGGFHHAVSTTALV